MLDYVVQKQGVDLVKDFFGGYMNESDITRKLVIFCKKNKTFRWNFASLFWHVNEHIDHEDVIDIEDIDFNDDIESEYGEPGITISISDGFKVFIIVKTRSEDDFHEKSCYLKLVNDGKSCLCYLLDKNHNSSKCLTWDIARWQEVWDLVRDFNNQELLKDIQQNVDDIETGE